MEELKGVTINERLFALKVTESFDAAIKSKNCKAAIEVLEQCGLSYSSALETVSSIFKNPKRYGY
ncbi:MAG TPA: hypothetical protein DCW74_12845 [Alteromonas australica]|jgi:hypothetical protein|uniref:Uncharacterized protein n=1 Tax=Alteromonas australica TaxID=589873 RepID=A0A350P5P1_9ALTE|nr:hypothetical protein [Alteromonas australica]MBU34544.1 hypothetical protein [Alteromonas sp.]HAW76608.1 hypothetical protein [Alteromonas australica]|tara:strand:- start:2191 stop:2385 length:195 start_codon:yes stop_codon:yes gene_type:complete